MTILDQLTDQMKNALREHDSARLSAIRMLISAIKYAMVDTPDIDEAGVIAILSKEAKKRREAIEAYKAAGRMEQAEGEEFELTIIEGYLPKMLSEEEIKAKLQGISDKLAGKNMGEAMKIAMGEMKGSAEAGVVAKVVRELL